MRPFIFETAYEPQHAIELFDKSGLSAARSAVYLAGGTTLLDLMKLDVMRPQVVIDISALERSSLGRIDVSETQLRLGALARMAETAEHPAVKDNYPVIAQSLQLAASPQLRNMATLGGNVLQRTRCNYFRDVSNPACNKRNPGSGCAAIDGFNRRHAVLGGSDQCIATYPGDFAQALIALDAMVELRGPKTDRTVSFATIHRRPEDAPQLETTLLPGEMITAFIVPTAPWTRRSLYLKVRDRQSYEFALASAAVALDLNGAVVRQARIALGGVATVPWRSLAAEAALRDKPLDETSANAAAEAAFAEAQPRDHNAYKIALGKRTLVRALREAVALEI
jgi:xanthine dehydrogenase YagS FAD-binding subunit